MPQFKKTRIYFIQGKCKWFRNKTVNQWDKYSHQLYPDQKGMEILRELQAEGMKNVIKKDDDGWYINFGRPVVKETASGKKIGFEPPEVFDKDGVPFDGLVGNGSDITTKIEVYPYDFKGNKGIGVRWVSSRVDNLVPYEMDRDASEETKDAARGLKDQPEQLF